jgi:dihydrofolate reductase
MAPFLFDPVPVAGHEAPTPEGGTMKRVRYSVAMSLDGYLAGPSGEIDWITEDPDVDFVALAAQFDTMVMGRKTYEFARAHGASVRMPGIDPYVFSRTLQQGQCPDATVSDDVRGTVSSLKRKEGKDIWLFGGGSLFHSLLDLGLVDTVEVTVIPVLLGKGVPLLPERDARTALRFVRHRLYSRTGRMSLEYEVA